MARDSDARLRDIAEQVGITERSVSKIVTELEEGGIIVRAREGRRNHYEISVDMTLRHPLESHRTVGDLLRSLLAPSELSRLGLRSRSVRSG